jgi:hypothetical protein
MYFEKLSDKLIVWKSHSFNHHPVFPAFLLGQTFEAKGVHDVEQLVFSWCQQGNGQER